MKIISTKTQRTTSLRLSQDEFEDAIRQYLIKHNVQDANQHLVILTVNTKSDRGTELEIFLTNNNKDNNMFGNVFR